MIKAAKAFLLGIVVFVLLVNVAYAAGSKLIFSDVDVKVGSKTSKNLNNGETIDDEADPGDSVEFRVEMKNNFTSAEDLKIEDVSVDVTIEAIDDGDDLDDESSQFDLRPGNDKRVNLKFQVPIEVEEDTFDVVIHAEGDDENGTNQEVEMRLRLDVNKESHLLKITKNTLSPAEITCNRKNIQLSTNIINIGNDDEKDVTVQVLSPDLGVDLKEDAGELTAEPNEDESRFSKIFTFNVPNDAEAGSYPVLLRALYDDDRKKAEGIATLTVNDCATAKQSATTSSSTTSEAVVVSPATGATTGTTTTAVAEQTPEGATLTQEGFLKSNAFVTGIIIAEVVAVIVGIVLVVSLFRRRG